jgi:hypothetical protein
MEDQAFFVEWKPSEEEKEIRIFVEELTPKHPQ